jgi:hypothetical protein
MAASDECGGAYHDLLAGRFLHLEISVDFETYVIDGGIQFARIDCL